MRNLSTTNANAVTLTAPTSAAQVVPMGCAGNGSALTLLSSAASTALVVNSGTSIMSGNTHTNGYRHYAPPVSGATVGNLTTADLTSKIIRVNYI